MNLTTGTHRIMRPLVLLAALLLPLTALAGGTATFQTSGDTMQLAWQDGGAVRMKTSERPGYMLMRDGKLYSITVQDGKTSVMDISGMIKMFSAMAGKKSVASFGRIDSIEATGDSATVAGIDGHIYRITMTDSDGKTTTKKTVLTDNPLVVEMTTAYVDALLGTLAPDIAQNLNTKLPADERGLLQSGGDDFKLVSISGAEPDAQLFELPAKPSSLGSMIQMMMQKSQQ